jgi:Ca2+-binding RTX toxin-like protein
VLAEGAGWDLLRGDGGNDVAEGLGSMESRAVVETTELLVAEARTASRTAPGTTGGTGARARANSYWEMRRGPALKRMSSWAGQGIGIGSSQGRAVPRDRPDPRRPHLRCLLKHHFWIEDAQHISINEVTMIGTDGRNTLIGGAGNDHIEGRGGDDRLRGNMGADLLDGGDGSDFCVLGETVLNCES